MTTYCYLHTANEEQDSGVQTEVRQYIARHKLHADVVIEDTKSVKKHWKKREIGKLFQTKRLEAQDNIVVFEAANLARSTSQMLEILVEATQREINIHFAKYDTCFCGKATNNLEDLLLVMQHIECDFIARRTTDALARRRAAGLPLGRPKGRKNKSLKLDRHRKDILRYLELNLSKASIAKLVGCHPQTLYDWIERQGVAAKASGKEVARIVRAQVLESEAQGV